MFVCTSDWHLDQEEILEHERGKKFTSIESHDEYIVECVRRWLSKMHAEDTFYFLGDFGHPKEQTYQDLKECFDRASCRTVAIRGNHDKEDYEVSILRSLFDDVYDYPLWIAPRVVISHYPCAVWKDEINIHGHTHSSKLKSCNHICASIHVSNYKPITDKTLSSAFGKIPKRDRRFLYEPWADMYQFTQKKEDVIYDKNRNIDLSASRVMMRLKENGKIE